MKRFIPSLIVLFSLTTCATNEENISELKTHDTPTETTIPTLDKVSIIYKQLSRITSSSLQATGDIEENENLTLLLNQILKSSKIQKNTDYKIYTSSKQSTSNMSGTIIVNESDIKNSTSPQELMAIIAHEIGHHELQHVTKAINQHLDANTIESLYKNLSLLKNKSTITEDDINEDVIHEIQLLGKAKKKEKSQTLKNNELEADHQALIYLTDLGIEINGFINYLTRLKESDSWSTIRTTHPSPLTRIQKLKKYPEYSINIKNGTSVDINFQPYFLLKE